MYSRVRAAGGSRHRLFGWALILFVGVALAGVVAVGPAAGTNHCDVTVASGQSIQDAVNGSASGDTVCLEDGNFSESVVVGVDNITIAAADGASPVLEGAGAATAFHVVDADHVTIRNLTIQGYTDEGVRVTEANGNRSDNLSVKDAVIQGSDYGVFLDEDSARNATIERTEFFENANRPIYVHHDNDGAAIHHNQIHDSEAQWGIYVRNAPEATVTNNTVDGARISVWDVDSVVRDNIVSGGYAGIEIRVDADGAIVENNTITDVEIGISAQTADPEIRNNTVSNATIGLELDGATTATVRDNALDTGMAVSGDPTTFGHYDHDVANNTLADGELIYINGATDPVIPANAAQIFIIDSTNVAVSGYDLAGIPTGILIGWSDGAEITNNSVADTGGHGLHIVSTDNSLVENNTFSSNGVIQDGNAITVEESQSTVLRGNSMTDSEREAIDLSFTPDTIIESNDIVENYEGIGATQSDRLAITNNTITDSHHGGTTSNIRGAVRVSGSIDVIVSENNISNNHVNGVFDNRDMDAMGVTIKDNIIHNNGHHGIRWRDGDEATVENNSLRGNGGYGIHLSRDSVIRNNSILNNGGGIDVSPNVTVEFNTINNHSSGIGIQAYRNSVIRDNTMENNLRGLQIGMVFNPGTETNLIENNTVRSDTVDVVIGAERLTIRNNTFESGVRMDAGLTPEVGLLTTHTFTNNTVGGQPLVHIHGQDNVTVTEPAGQVIVTNSTGVTLENLSFSNTASAIQVAFSNRTDVADISVADSTGEFPDRGALTLWSSHDSTIRDSILTDNQNWGVELVGSTNTTVLDNRIEGTGDTGIRVDGENAGVAAHGNSLSGNGEGIENVGNQQINATDNWWGDGTGPSGGETDPETGITASGTGDSVSSEILFDPWLDSEPLLPDPAFFEVSNVSANDTVLAGDTHVVNATVTNTGDTDSTQSITLEDLDGNAVDSESITLAGGEATNLTLSWLTDDGDVGSGDVTISSEDDSASSPLSVVPNGTIELGTCQAITIPGEYQLTGNLSSSQTCLEIQVGGVTIDGMGYAIEGSNVDEGTTQYGVVAGSSETITSVTVENVTIRNWDGGLYYDDADDGVIEDVTTEGNGAGVRFQAADDNNVSNLTTRNNTYRGLHVGFITASNGNSFENVTAVGNEQSGLYPGSIYMAWGQNNEFVDVNASNNQAGVIAGTGGNTFTDIVANDNSRYGLVVETAYGSTFENISVSGNAWHGIFLDGSQGSTFTNVSAVANDGTGIFFNSGADDNTFTDVFIADNDGEGGSFSSSNNNVLDGVTVENNTDDGIQFTSGQGNTVTNLSAGPGSGAAINVQPNSQMITVTNVAITDRDGGLSLHGSETVVENVTMSQINATALTVSNSDLGAPGSSLQNVSIETVAGSGVQVFGDAIHELVDVTVSNVSGVGMRVDGHNNGISESAVENATVGLELYDVRSSNFENVSLDGTTISLTGEFVRVNGTPSPAAPPTPSVDIGHQVEVTPINGDGLIDQLVIHYSAADLGSVTPESLRIWRHANGTWADPGNETFNSGFDLGTQTVFALNVTAEGVYAPLGDSGPVPTGQLAGRALDNGEALPNVAVLIEEDSQGYVDYVMTNGTGDFQFDAPVGTYNFTVIAPGYLETQVTDVAVTENATTTRDINVTPIPDPGTVTGTFRNALTEEPIHGYWTVTATHADSGEEYVETFSSTTMYEMDLPAGTYTLEAVFEPVEQPDLYKPATVEGVEIQENQTTEQDVELEPYAQFTYTPVEPFVGQEVTFDASNSTLPIGTVEEYLWNFEATEGIDYNSTQPTLSHTFDSTGTHNVTLIVVDPGSEEASSVTRPITVTNPPPPPPPPSSSTDRTSDRRSIDGPVVIQATEGADGSLSIDSDTIEEGTDVTINLPTGTAGQSDWPVDISSISFTVTEDTDLSMDLYTDEEPPQSGATAFERDDGTSVLLYHQLIHQIADEAVEDVAFEFQVDTDVLEDDEEPGDIALYRLTPGAGAEGEWVELETTLEGETDGQYRYSATSPGLSQFATGVKQAQFVIRDAMVSVAELQIGDSTEISVQIDNTGGASGTFTAELWIDGELSEERDLTIAEGGTRQTTFDRTFEEAGTYEVIVNDFSSGEISVAGAGSDEDGGFGLMGVVIVIALAAAGAGAYVLYRREDQDR